MWLAHGSITPPSRLNEQRVRSDPPWSLGTRNGYHQVTITRGEPVWGVDQAVLKRLQFLENQWIRRLCRRWENATMNPLPRSKGATTCVRRDSKKYCPSVLRRPVTRCTSDAAGITDPLSGWESARFSAESGGQPSALGLSTPTSRRRVFKTELVRR
jgi:hypothetical protein